MGSEVLGVFEGVICGLKEGRKREGFASAVLKSGHIYRERENRQRKHSISRL